ncbi:MAG TPA: hypothetical protein VJG64_03230 [Candidatus Paceibacterota bacterium]
MRTISQAVEEIIGRSPFYMEAIAEGIANNAQIARKIKPDVEKRLYEEVSEAAIAMALHRMAKNIQRPQYGARFLKRVSDITVRSNLVEFSLPHSSDILPTFEAVAKSAELRKELFFNLSIGLYEIIVIANVELVADIEKALGRIIGVRKTENLSAITMRLPEESLSVPGVYYPILRAIALEGISFVEVMSVRTEFSILFDNKDVDRAFSVIKRITS